MSKQPITDAINKQFDTWEAQIDEWETQGKEYAKEQAKKLQEDVKEWAEKKKKELEEQNKESGVDEEGNSNNKIVQIMKEIQEKAKEMKPDPEKIAAIVDTVKKMAELMEKLVNDLTACGMDLMNAAIVLPQRTAQLQNKITNIGGGLTPPIN